MNHLFDKDFDGLFNGNSECACLATDLMPCDNPGINCTAGYKTADDGESFKISLKKDLNHA